MFKFLWVCWLWIIMFSAVTAMGQSKIKTTRVLSDTSSFNFTSEWQYLSTDIYLFNANKFNKLINELDFTKEQEGGFLNFKKERNEFLEYLFITASLKNVRFFDDQEITYPLYNFRVNKEKDNQYRTYISDDIDHIRIIDNLPLYAATDYIDAEIEVHAITNNQGDQILGLVAGQLKNIAQIANPSTAVLALVGELGNFMESSTRKKEYHFSSTIRLYEKKDFDSRLHSIIIYALKTDNSDGYEISGDQLSIFLEDPFNSRIDREKLASLIDFQDYPYLVVANYKSLYRMDAVTGDEITYAAIERRKLKIENDFHDGLISQDTYLQEKDFLDFLKIFAELKKALEMYNLNFKTGNNEAISNTLFNIVTEYQQLLQTYKHYRFKYEHNPTFHNIFRSEYESIIGYAGLYLEKDHYLNNARLLVETSMQADTLQLSELDSLETEKILESLHFSDIFSEDRVKSTTFGKSVKNQIQRLEKQHFFQYFDERIQEAGEAEIKSSTPEIIRSLQHSAKSTYCEMCRDSSLSIIDNYLEAQEQHRKKIALREMDSLRNHFATKLIMYYDKLENIGYNLNYYFGQDTANKVYQIIEAKYLRAKRDVENLNNLLKKDRSWLETIELELIENYKQKLIDYSEQVDEKLHFVCENEKKLCVDKEETRKVKERTQRIQLEAEFESIHQEHKRKLSAMESTFNSFLQTENDSLPADSVKNNTSEIIYKDVTKLISDYKSELTSFHPETSEEYKLALQTIKKAEKQFLKSLSKYCFDVPVYCVLIGSYREAGSDK